MHIKFLFVLLFAAFTSSVAQTPTLIGKVIDNSSGLPISYVTIVVKEGEKVVSGGITDDNGLFSVGKLENKIYNVEISYMGYKTHLATADFTAGN